jgi:LmbE family N-acetylglucosaminyl deacetylase
MKLHWPRAQHLYLSPHPDDVILSCGGMIWEQVQRGDSVAVVTVFADSPSPSLPLSDFAQLLHDRWHASAPDGDFADPPAVRRAEDTRSFEVLDRRIVLAQFPLTDCIYRTHPYLETPLYASEEAIFGELHPADPAREKLVMILPPEEGTIVYSPLAIGNHVDHQLVRSIVGGWGLDAGRVRFYEDYPHVVIRSNLEKIVGQHEGWVSKVTPLSDAALHAKIHAAAQHASQISTFWKSIDAMDEALHSYAAQVGGERLWIQAGRP